MTWKTYSTLLRTRDFWYSSFLSQKVPGPSSQAYLRYDDIKQADGVSPDYYAAGTQIDTITTDNTGVAIMENLPLGRYMVKEIATQDGYVLDDQPRLIDLTYRDSKTPVVTYSEAWQNERA